LIDWLWITPAAALLSTGILDSATTPAFISKLRLPIERLEIVVEPLAASTVNTFEPLDPTEKRPALDRVSRDVDALLAISRALPLEALAPQTVSFAYGDEVPNPILPEGAIKILDVPTALLVPLK
jgi:hypothetical protein